MHARVCFTHCEVHYLCSGDTWVFLGSKHDVGTFFLLNRDRKKSGLSPGSKIDYFLFYVVNVLFQARLESRWRETGCKFSLLTSKIFDTTLCGSGLVVCFAPFTK